LTNTKRCRRLGPVAADDLIGPVAAEHFVGYVFAANAPARLGALSDAVNR
jgi:hypothetical protein